MSKAGLKLLKNIIGGGVPVPPPKPKRHSSDLLEKVLTEGAPTQSVPSAATSVNVTKKPAMFGKIKWTEGTVNADIGGGKHDAGTGYLQKQGVTNHVIDPHNRSAEHNIEAWAAVRGGQADTATVANVLNVIVKDICNSSRICLPSFWTPHTRVTGGRRVP